MENKIFGNKEVFAIETRPHKKPQKHFLRIWLHETVIGNYKNAGSLDYIINSYFKIVKNFHCMYENKFYQMNQEEIFHDIMYDLGDKLSLEDENVLFKRMKNYSFDLGDHQFNDFTFLALNPNKDNTIKFIIFESNSKGESKVHAHEIDYAYFKEVYKSFLQYAYEKDLKKYKPFFPEGFSYRDIE